ncbi:MAG: hypothetical protein AAFX93_15400 [Verrucomicrobiota bacterium]
MFQRTIVLLVSLAAGSLTWAQDSSSSRPLPHEEMATQDAQDTQQVGATIANPGHEVHDSDGWDWLPTLDWEFRFKEDQPNFAINATIYAYHFNPELEPFEEPLNDWTWGIGFNYELIRDPDFIWSVNADIVPFDSTRDFAADIGTSIQWHNPVVDVGAQFMILYKRNFENEWGVPVGPALFPYLQREFDFFALRMYWIPPVRKASDNQVIFQVMVPIGTTSGL